MNISLSEILLVLIVALVVIKPEQLPGVAFKIGRFAQQFRKGMTQLRRELDGTVISKEIESRDEPRKS